MASSAWHSRLVAAHLLQYSYEYVARRVPRRYYKPESAVYTHTVEHSPQRGTRERAHGAAHMRMVLRVACAWCCAPQSCVRKTWCFLPASSALSGSAAGSAAGAGGAAAGELRAAAAAAADEGHTGRLRFS